MTQTEALTETEAMTETEILAADLIARFEHAAEAAGVTEQAYRRESTARIEALTLERTHAFRRLNLVRSIATAIADTGEPEEAPARARILVANALGWDEIGPRQALVLDRLTPVFEAMRADLSMSERPPTPESQAALRTFEDWYRQETGTEFYALFDRYVPETPRVDF